MALVPPSDSLGLATHAVTVAGPTTVALAAVLTTNHAWYGAPGSLDEVLTDEAPTFLASSIEAALAEHCDGGDLLDGIETIEQIYQPGFAAAAAAGEWDAIEPWSCYLATSTVRLSPVPLETTTPTLFVVSGEDDLVAADVTRADFQQLCDAGYSMEYLECEGASHTEGAALSLPFQWEWVQARLAGEPLAAPCTYTDPVDCAEFGLME